MNKMNPTLFDAIFNNSKRNGKDDFPTSNMWKSEINKWLLFIQSKNQLDRYRPRLINVSKPKRDESLAEICAAYTIEKNLGYPIISWEEKTVNGKDVDFIILDNTKKIYCEVKSPGWESELEQKERLNERKKLPKHINGEVRSIAPWEAIRHTIKKSYEKFLPNCTNLVIMKDDLFVNVIDNPGNIVDIALFEEHGAYCNEKGYFASKDFENVGGILCLHCKLRAKIEYGYKFIANPNAINSLHVKTI